ncbi:hypothetical protein C5B42_03150 [Candidatus Cerribacteria bacterium 'Amazon FNV 2010 28 9']|uniref:DUF5660 domain-containing protein n=1 Tax=Candidatus Cerribacteria bacterium 'Amazon FNV 2010 28 9' TaxID=2081795 RepID=A0A317JSS1_9BACT|nr:MAG: hypothetical protein C5B42_03150 [Candidatus Cerribacteria bacterium 'Amazon FNV 2010 28 9']
MPGKPNQTPTSYSSSAVNPFARAIQEIGGTTVKQTAALPGEMMNDAMSAIFGGGGSVAESSQDQNQNSTNPFAKALEQTSNSEQQKELNLEKQQAVLHKEFQMTEVFNLREQKDKETIKQLQEQLRALAKEIKQLDQSTHTAIYADVVDPGTYHVNFFQQLLNFIVLLRKRVQEGNTWIENFNARGKKKGAFWGQVYSKKGGTAYMMSQEHQVARNVG